MQRREALRSVEGGLLKTWGGSYRDGRETSRIPGKRVRSEENSGN